MYEKYFENDKKNKRNKIFSSRPIFSSNESRNEQFSRRDNKQYNQKQVHYDDKNLFNHSYRAMTATRHDTNNSLERIQWQNGYVQNLNSLERENLQNRPRFQTNNERVVLPSNIQLQEIKNDPLYSNKPNLTNSQKFKTEIKPKLTNSKSNNLGHSQSFKGIKEHVEEEEASIALKPTGQQKKAKFFESSESEDNPFSKKRENEVKKSNHNKFFESSSSESFRPIQDFEKDLPPIFSHEKNMNNEDDDNKELEIILESSPIYKEYMNQIKMKKIAPKPSLDIPQLREAKRDLNKLVADVFYKPPRVQFKKVLQISAKINNFNGSNYVCLINRQKSCIFYHELSHENVRFLEGSKCQQLVIQEQDKIAPSIELDHNNSRFFCYSNKKKSIFVYSSTTQDFLCQFPVQKPVINPILYLYGVHSRSFLLIIGGYTKIQKDTVGGNQYIEIFQIKKWDINLKSRLIKMIIGRISPIIIPYKAKEQFKLLLLGGHTIAKIKQINKLNFEHQKDINYSTNLTGISINSKQIIDLFDYQQLATYSNLSVKIENPTILYSGYAMSISSSIMLMLPNSRSMFQVKIINRQINILPSQRLQITIESSSEAYNRLNINYLVSGKDILLYKVDEKGLINKIKTDLDYKDSRCGCLIY